MSFRRLFAGLCVAVLIFACRDAVAGSPDGGLLWRGRVDAGTTVVLEVEFVAGEPARVFGIGDGDTDVDYAVKDKKGNYVAMDLGLADVGFCEFVPERNGTYFIEITNLGDIWNGVRLATN